MILFLILPVLALADEKSSPQSTQQADISCDQQYPWCKDKSGDIAGLVKNFYNYALAAVGVAALGAIIFGGVKYTVSAGNPSSQTDAISWITGAVWGLVLLLGANLLLRTINPQLVNLEMTKLEPVNMEVSAQSPVSQQKTMEAWGKIPGSPFNTISPNTLEKVKQLYSNYINQACQGSKMSDCNSVVTALIAAESGGKVNVQSGKGAFGLMQLKEVNGGKVCLSNEADCIQDQIQKGVNLLNKAYKRTKDTSLSLAEYNGGGAASKPSACCSTGYYAYECPWDCGTTKSHSYNCDVTAAINSVDPACHYNSGFNETRNYVKKICGAAKMGCLNN